VRIDLDAVPMLPVFQWLAQAGGVAEAEMLRTFNCGVGMIAIAAPDQARAVAGAFAGSDHAVRRLGEVTEAAGERVVYAGRLALTS
jgi:phosphoribosylformylglycinamidine cyclo-ligase